MGPLIKIVDTVYFAFPLILDVEVLGKPAGGKGKGFSEADILRPGNV